MRQPRHVGGVPAVTPRQDGPVSPLSVRKFLYISLVLFLAGPTRAAQPTKQKWLRVSSDHFSVLTDADEKKAREVAVRFEQMRSIVGQLLLRRKLNMSEPIEIIALRSDKEYADIAPIRQGQPLNAPGFFLAGTDRDYIVLNMFEPESWRAVSHDLAHYFLNYNYPPTQPWFDEGFAEYFSSLHLHDKTADIGADPEIGVTWNQDIFGNQIQQRTSLRSLTEQLDTPVWLSLPDLFSMHEYRSGFQEGTHHTLFYAQSWIVVHYLLNKNQLAETGIYFDLVQNQKLPTPQAIQQAFAMSAAQYDQAVKNYFKSLTPLFLALDASKQPDAKSFDLESSVYQVSHVAAPLAAEDIGTSTAQISDAEAQAAVAEMALRLPEHRQQATTELQAIVNNPKTENAIAHRALAWATMQKKDFAKANEELTQASPLDPKDPWTHFYLALIKFQQAQNSAGPIPGLANMMQDLQAVLDWNPYFAEAYNMLAMGRLQGGGTHSAMNAIRPAIQFDPRNETYQLNLAQIEMAGKKWDDATELLTRLQASPNPQIAHAAHQRLDALPTLKKYGVLPLSGAPENSPPIKTSQPQPSSHDSEPSQGAELDQPAAPPVAIGPDKRQIKFAKGMLVKVDCSHPPAAVLSITTAGRNLKLRSADYPSMLLIGAGTFSCEWNHLPVTVNYKERTKAEGDLVSLELQ